MPPHLNLRCWTMLGQELPKRSGWCLQAVGKCLQASAAPVQAEAHAALRWQFFLCASAGLCVLAHSAPLLQRLDMDATAHTTQQGAAHLARLAHLHTLSCADCSMGVQVTGCACKCVGAVCTWSGTGCPMGVQVTGRACDWVRTSAHGALKVTSWPRSPG